MPPSLKRALAGVVSLLGMNVLSATAVEIKVVRPEPGEGLSITSGSIFVIGTVTPGATLTCNGAECDVSDDGAFIGFAPIRRLDDFVMTNGKRCDARFHFKAHLKGTGGATDQAASADAYAYTPDSPSSAVTARQIYDPPRRVHIPRPVWLGFEGARLGDVMFVPEGATLALTEGNASSSRYRTPSGAEVTILNSEFERPSDDTEPAKGPSPLELKIPDQKTVRTVGKNGASLNSGHTIWGFRFDCAGGPPRFEPRRHFGLSDVRLDFEKPLQNLRICLDPGHNPDPGAVGPRGLSERESNRLIAEQTAELLREEGAEVVFTHQADPLPLRQRHPKMHDQNPDLVLSIHNNSTEDGVDPRTRHGTQTFYLFPWSKPLAESVHQAMLECLGTTNLGCIRRNLYITRFPECPTILVEPEYIILPDQEKKFMDPDYRKKLARALVEGLRNFVLAVGSPPPEEKPSPATSSEPQ